jgi:hypothetical protein
MIVNGEIRTLGTIGELASAVGRTSHTVRGWERQGLIPPPPLIVQPGEVCTRRRLYPTELISAIQEVAQNERFGTRRPSGMFAHQQEAIWSTWRAVVDSLNSDGEEQGVTESLGG